MFKFVKMIWREASPLPKLGFWIVIAMLWLMLLVALGVPLHAASYYVSSAGSDSNDGSLSTPWLTLQHSVNSVACGDIINVVANGSFVAGDANLPNMPCTARITVQSSKIAKFAPVGYRTNPTNDAANYGKLSFTAQGISAAPGVWTYNQYFSYAGVSFDTATGYVTITGGNGLTSPNLANGSQVEIESTGEGSSYGGPVFPVILAPGGLSFLTHYYVVSCGAGPVGSQGYPQTCGQQNSRFKLALTSGGAPLAIPSCGLYCASTVIVDPSGACSLGQIQYNSTNSKPWGCPGGTWVESSVFMFAGVTTSVDTSANTLTIPNNYGPGSLSNGAGVAFSTAGLQVFGALPAPLQVDKTYYIQNLSGRTFKVSTDVAGANLVTLTSVGTGMISTATTAMPSNWLFDGLEMAPAGVAQPFYLFLAGKGVETSLAGMATHFELSRSYLHDNPPTVSITHAFIDNGVSLYIHDSWITGADLGEAQALSGTASPGPTIISNNFLSAAGEITLYGGNSSPYSPANANKLFIGNYFYKPPVYKVSTGTIAPSGSCLYDCTDPLHCGGEYYRDTVGNASYQCPSNGTWGAPGASIPDYARGLYNGPVIKDMSEHKNGSYFTYIGNLYNYSIAQDQSGQLFNNSMEYGSGAGMANDHITIMNNAGYNSFVFMSRTSQCFPAIAACPNLPGNHVTKNNLLVLNPLVCGTSMNPGCGFSTAGYSATTGGVAPYFNDDQWEHNTIWSPHGSGPGPDGYPFASLGPMSADTPTGGCPPYSPLPVNRMIYRNSLVVGDFTGACNAAGAILLNNYSNSTFANNALKGGNCCGGYTSGAFGTGNKWTNGVFPASNAVINFVSGTGALGGDYHLAAASPYSAANGSATQLSTDGTDLGGDIDLVNMATSGAAPGTPPWDQLFNLRIVPGSFVVLVTYTTTQGPCTFTAYNSIVRISTNIAFSGSDNGAGNISDGQRREILITTGPSPSTVYPYKLDCGSGVVMVGTFTTRASGSGTYNFWETSNSTVNITHCIDRAMTSSCGTQASTSPLAIVSNNYVYVRQTADTGPPSIRLAP